MTAVRFCGCDCVTAVRLCDCCKTVCCVTAVRLCDCDCVTAVRLCDCAVHNNDWLNNTKGLKHLQSNSTKPSLFKCVSGHRQLLRLPSDGNRRGRGWSTSEMMITVENRSTRRTALLSVTLCTRKSHGPGIKPSPPR